MSTPETNYTINLFRQPDKLRDAETLVKRLQIELQFVKAYEGAKERLKSKKKLPPFILAHCSAFVAGVVSSTKDASSNFDTEVRKLTRDEMEFASISLSGKALHGLKEWFQASALRDKGGNHSTLFNWVDLIDLRRQFNSINSKPDYIIRQSIFMFS